MELKIRYRLLGNNSFLSTSDTNKDLTIESKLTGNRHIINLKVNSDCVLDDVRLFNVSRINDEYLFLTNGIQSWTDTLERSLEENSKEKDAMKIPSLVRKPFALDKYGDAWFYKYNKNLLHGYDVFYIKGDKSLFSFSNNYKIAYLIYEIYKKEHRLDLVSDVKGLELKKGDTFTLFDFDLYDDYSTGVEAFNKKFQARTKEKVFGYTSWYNYYQNINEEIILRDLDALDSRFNLFQIDDGYETYVGDWMDVDPVKFPHGLKDIVNKIHQKGYKAGLWLAPFAVESKSKTFKEHPEWLRKDSSGNPIKCGANWSGFYALDLENKEAKEYLTKCLNYYVDMGFDFFKLDFLYASMVNNGKNKTRAMYSDESYQLLRDILKDKLILGCGAAISSSYQKFDYLRIGPDVSLKFDDAFYMRWLHRERVSTKITLQNTIFRHLLDGHYFLNDPDVFLLRKDNISLSDKQKEALVTINALFGSVLMTSDDIATYDQKTKNLLEDKFELFYKAEDKSYKKNKDKILISYKLDGNKYELIYDTKKGILQ